jgi:hypothetical protein
MSKYIPWVLILFITISSCGVITHSISLKNKKFIPADSVRNLVQKNYFKYEWFSAKAKIVIINNQGKTDFTASIRAKHDSVIWISISPALGIEAVRVLMTKDSVKIIDRFNRTYTARDYSVFKDYTSLPVNLSTLEDIVSGIPIYFDAKKAEEEQKDTMVMLTSGKKKIQNTLYLNSDYTIWRMDVIDSLMGKSMKLKYKSYNHDNAKPFALERELELNDSKKTNVFIYFSKVKINEPLKFPFKEKYE